MELLGDLEECEDLKDSSSNLLNLEKNSIVSNDDLTKVTTLTHDNINTADEETIVTVNPATITMIADTGGEHLKVSTDFVVKLPPSSSSSSSSNSNSNSNCNSNCNQNDETDNRTPRLRSSLAAYSTKWNEISDKLCRNGIYNGSSEDSTRPLANNGEFHKFLLTRHLQHYDKRNCNLQIEQAKILEQRRNTFSTAIARNEIHILRDTSITGRYGATQIEPFGHIPSSQHACRNGFYDVIKLSIAAYRTSLEEEESEDDGQNPSSGNDFNDPGLAPVTLQHNSLSGNDVDAGTAVLAQQHNYLSTKKAPGLVPLAQQQNSLSDNTNSLEEDNSINDDQNHLSSNNLNADLADLTQQQNSLSSNDVDAGTAVLAQQHNHISSLAQQNNSSSSINIDDSIAALSHARLSAFARQQNPLLGNSIDAGLAALDQQRNSLSNNNLDTGKVSLARRQNSLLSNNLDAGRVALAQQHNSLSGNNVDAYLVSLTQQNYSLGKNVNASLAALMQQHNSSSGKVVNVGLAPLAQEHKFLSNNMLSVGPAALTQQDSSLSDMNVDSGIVSLNQQQDSLSEIIFPNPVGSAINPPSYQPGHINTNLSLAENRFTTSASAESRALLFSAITDEIGRRKVHSLHPPSTATLPLIEDAVRLGGIPLNGDDCIIPQQEWNQFGNESSFADDRGMEGGDESYSDATTVQRKNLGHVKQSRKMYPNYKNKRSRRRNRRRETRGRRRYKTSAIERLSSSESSSSSSISSEEMTNRRQKRKRRRIRRYKSTKNSNDICEKNISSDRESNSESEDETFSAESRSNHSAV